MTKYVQRNEAGYVTGIVDEPLLVGLFGNARRLIEIPDEDASVIEKLLESHHSRGEGLLLDDAFLDNLKK